MTHVTLTVHTLSLAQHLQLFSGSVRFLFFRFSEGGSQEWG
jgi:hypothetical protein